MSTNISRQQVTESKAHIFTADASELGWQPGFIPPTFVTTDLGNGLILIKQRFDGERRTYRQLAGCIEVRIFNT